MYIYFIEASGTDAAKPLVYIYIYIIKMNIKFTFLMHYFHLFWWGWQLLKIMLYSYMFYGEFYSLDNVTVSSRIEQISRICKFPTEKFGRCISHSMLVPFYQKLGQFFQLYDNSSTKGKWTRSSIDQRIISIGMDTSSKT